MPRRSPLKEFINAVRSVLPLVVALVLLVRFLLRDSLPPMSVYLVDDKEEEEYDVQASYESASKLRCECLAEGAFAAGRDRIIITPRSFLCALAQK